MGERLWDVSQCVDYISTLKEVQAERMGCAGLSLGGEMAMWLGAMDPRMKVTVNTSASGAPLIICTAVIANAGTSQVLLRISIFVIFSASLHTAMPDRSKRAGGFPAVNSEYEAMTNIQRVYAVGSHGNLARLDIHPEGHVFQVSAGCTFIGDALDQPLSRKNIDESVP